MLNILHSGNLSLVQHYLIYSPHLKFCLEPGSFTTFRYYLLKGEISILLTQESLYLQEKKALVYKKILHRDLHLDTDINIDVYCTIIFSSKNLETV